MGCLGGEGGAGVSKGEARGGESEVSGGVVRFIGGRVFGDCEE